MWPSDPSVERTGGPRSAGVTGVNAGRGRHDAPLL